MKLHAIALHEPPRGMRFFDNYFVVGVGNYKDWTVQVKGASVFLTSPPGWQMSGKTEGEIRRVVEVPRAHCTLYWDAEAEEATDDAPRVDASSDDAPRKRRSKLEGSPPE